MQRTHGTRASVWVAVIQGERRLEAGPRTYPRARVYFPTTTTTDSPVNTRISMSSISFPGTPASPHGMNGDLGESFYGIEPPPRSPFSDTGAGFTMNPLSAHPPRTPRASIITNTTHVYGAEIYSEKPGDSSRGGGAGGGRALEENEHEEEEDVDELLDAEDARARARAARIRRSEVFRSMLQTSSGRDKAFVSTIFSALNVSFVILTRSLLERNSFNTRSKSTSSSTRRLLPSSSFAGRRRAPGTPSSSADWSRRRPDSR
jgi:hypothetical protein